MGATEGTSGAGGTSRMHDDETGVWVYAVYADPDQTPDPAADGDATGDLPGVAGEDVRVVRAAGLAAIVGTVDLARFGEEGLRRGLNDLDQLEQMARAHHGVVGRAARSQTVAPTRLATVYEDDDRVRAMLVDQQPSLRAALRHVNGREEWGVKAYRAQRSAADDAPAERPASGTDYLRRRQAALGAHAESQRTAGAGAEAIHAELLPLTVGSRRHRPQDQKLSGDARPMVLNNAYLVQRERSEAFATAVRRMGREHPELDIELTGPWPPYSFAVIEEGGPR
jgi:gas vesicle protein GvpL/GvpF